MIFLTLGLFVLRSLIGFLVIDILWKSRDWNTLLLKAALSPGIGMGISSLGYFLYLTFFAGKHFFVYFEITLLIVLLFIRYQKGGFSWPPKWEKPTWLQITVGTLALFVLLTSLLGLINYVFQRQVGDWDAWMIFNRSARFIYRNPQFWQDAFSEKLDIIFHADYPPMLAMSIASGWEALGRESIYIPMAQSLLFSIACVMTMALALTYLKSATQAGIGIILLWGASSFVYEGGRQTADIPLAFFMLTSVVFYHLFTRKRETILMVLAGFCAGLAAWTKNEGILFVLASGLVIILISVRRRSPGILPPFAIGVVLPLAAAIYFKLFITPASEFISTNITMLLFDISRHKIIFASFFYTFIGFGAEKLNGLLPILLVYFLLQSKNNGIQGDQYIYVLGILVIQVIGYYFVYLISPYDLAWHTSYSTSRLFAQLYPIFIFLILYAGKTPQELFSTNTR